VRGFQEKAGAARDGKSRFGQSLDSARRDRPAIANNDRPIGIAVSAENTTDPRPADCFVKEESGYDEWLVGKVGRTMERVDSGRTALRKHSDAMTEMHARLEARLGPPALPRYPATR